MNIHNAIIECKDYKIYIKNNNNKVIIPIINYSFTFKNNKLRAQHKLSNNVMINYSFCIKDIIELQTLTFELFVHKYNKEILNIYKQQNFYNITNSHKITRIDNIYYYEYEFDRKFSIFYKKFLKHQNIISRYFNFDIIDNKIMYDNIIKIKNLYDNNYKKIKALLCNISYKKNINKKLLNNYQLLNNKQLVDFIKQKLDNIYKDIFIIENITDNNTFIEICNDLNINLNIVDIIKIISKNDKDVNINE